MRSCIVVSAAVFSLALAVHAADPSVILHYTFDEGVGDTLHDASGNGNHAVVYGRAQWAQGVRGTAMDFNGSTDYAVTPDKDAYTSLSGMTLEAWIRADTYGSESVANILSKWGPGSSSDDAWALQIDGTNSHRGAYVTSTGASPTRVYSDSAVPLDQWVYVVGTWDGAQTHFYVNGVLKGTTTWAGPFNNDPTDVYVGRESQGLLHYFDGRIDEVRILSRALAVQEVAARYRSTLYDVPQLIAVDDPTTDRTPTFRWHPVSGATNYKVMIDTALSFTSPFAVTAYSAGDTTYTPTALLPYHVTYWQVSCNLDYGLYSEIGHFTIVNPATAPVLIPYAYDSTTDRYPMLQWYTVDGAAVYTIAFASNPQFGPVFLQGTVSATKYVPSTALPTGRIYWHVASDVTPGLFSATDTFTVVAFGSPSVRKPAEGASVAPTDSLGWTTVRDPSSPVRYDLVLSTRDDFSADTLAYQTSLNATAERIQDIPATLPRGVSIFWKVRATNNWAMRSAWSPTASFALRPTGVSALRGQGCRNMLTARWDAAAGAVIAYSLARPGPVDITVVDTRGQLAARLAHGASEAGSHRLVWGGADAHGRTVAPGCYVVSIAAPGFTRRVPLTIAR